MTIPATLANALVDGFKEYKQSGDNTDIPIDSNTVGVAPVTIPTNIVDGFAEWKNKGVDTPVDSNTIGVTPAAITTTDPKQAGGNIEYIGPEKSYLEKARDLLKPIAEYVTKTDPVSRDIANKTQQWAEGAVAGGKELNKAISQYRGTDPLADFSYSSYVPLEETQQQKDAREYMQRAEGNFTEETIKPAAYVGGLAKTIIAAPALASDFANDVEQNGLEQTIKDFSGISAVNRAIDNPDEFAHKMATQPVTTLSEFFPAFLTGKILYGKGKAAAKVYSNYAKAGETSGRNMRTEHPVDPLVEINSREPMIKDPITGEWRLKTSEELAAEKNVAPEIPIEPIKTPLVVQPTTREKTQEPDPYTNTTEPIAKSEIGKGPNPYAVNENPYGNQVKQGTKQPWQMTQEEFSKGDYAEPSVYAGIAKNESLANAALAYGLHQKGIGTLVSHYKDGVVSVHLAGDIAALKEAGIFDLPLKVQGVAVKLAPEMEINGWNGYYLDIPEGKVGEVLNNVKPLKRTTAQRATDQGLGLSYDELESENISTHRQHIEQALREGKPVPSYVLKEYPDLAEEASTIDIKPIISESINNIKELGPRPKTVAVDTPQTEALSNYQKALDEHNKTMAKWNKNISLIKNEILQENPNISTRDLHTEAVKRAKELGMEEPGDFVNPNLKTETATKQPGTDTPLSQELLQSALNPTEKIKQIGAVARGIDETIHDIKAIVSPASAGEAARTTARIMRDNMSGMARKFDIAEKSMDNARTYFSKATPEESLSFIDNIEHGKPQGNAALDNFARVMRQGLDERVNEIRSLGTGKLQEAIVNYFPHIWKDPKAAETFFGEWFGKRPLEGSKSFLKQRTIPTTAEGIARGLEPVSYNPVDLTLLKMREMDKYIMAHKTLNELKQQGLVKFSSGTKPEPEWVKIDDKIGTVYRNDIPNLNKAAKSQEQVTRSSILLWSTAEKLGLKDVVKTELGRELQKIKGAKINEAKKLLDKIEEEAMKVDKSGDVDTASMMWDNAIAEYEKTVSNKLPEHLVLNSLTKVLNKKLINDGTLLPAEAEALRKFVFTGRETPELNGALTKNPVLENLLQQLPNKGLRIAGNYWAQPDAARLINNYLSPGLRDKAAFKGLLAVGNTLNQYQLGMSAFHLGFTSFDAITSKVALALKQGFNLDFKGAVKSLAEAPLAPITTAIKGGRYKAEWYNPGKVEAPISFMDALKGDKALYDYFVKGQGKEVGQVMDALSSGGARARMDSFYQTKIRESALDAFRQAKRELSNGEYLRGATDATKAIVKGVLAIPEALPRWIMEEVVPRQKLGVAASMMKWEMERRPNMTHAELRKVAAEVWDSVDNRLGQLAYDNLFWNKTFKDSLMMSVRSVGWNVGTVREIGGGLIDTAKWSGQLAKMPVDYFRGKGVTGPTFSHRMSYVVALPLTVSIFGAVAQYLATGKGPQDLKDYFFPQIGELDKNGRPERVSLPSYMKDVYHVWQKPKETVTNKLHPIWSLMAELWNNKDYYNTEIRHPGDPLTQQAADVAKHIGKSAIPFAVQGYQKMAESDAPLWKKTLPFIGITPAPRDVNQTEAEELASKMIQSKIPPKEKTKEQAQKGDTLSRIQRDLQQGSTASLVAAKQEGVVDKDDYTKLLKEKGMSPLQRQVTRLSAEEAIEVFKVATPDEKDSLRKMIKTKVFNSLPHLTKDKQKELKEMAAILN